MPLRNISVHEATREQLKTFAELQFGLEIPNTANANTIRSKLSAAGFTGETIGINEPEPMVMGKSGKAQSHAGPDRPEATLDGRRWVWLTISEANEPGGQEAVQVVVNGRRMQIPRGVPTWCPHEYYGVLVNARYETYGPPRTQFEALGEKREVPRYAMTVHHMDPEPAEQAA
jgi:hypothetical protein